jgi:lipoprotein signal peptidase
MGDLTGICIVGIIVLGIYKLTELFVRKQERLAIIEKLSAADGEDRKLSAIHFPRVVWGQSDSGSWSVLRFSLLLIGVGLGFLVGFSMLFLISNAIESLSDGYFVILNFACVMIFGGLGLLIAYLIEMKQKKNEQR